MARVGLSGLSMSKDQSAGSNLHNKAFGWGFKAVGPLQLSGASHVDVGLLLGLN
jgi:hypothetical protein